MKLKILTWNLNFFYDNWYNRIKSINKVLEKEIPNNDIMVLQEATLPLIKNIDTIFSCLKSPLVAYTHHYTFSDEINVLFDKISSWFPEKKTQISSIIKFVMDKFFNIVSWTFCKFGKSFQDIYFKYPILLCFICFTLLPIILILGYAFLGMITITNKKIKTTVKSKFVGRLFQYSKFKYNNREILFCNVHLNEASCKKGYEEIKKIISFTEKIPHDILIFAGDFNASPISKVYKYLTTQGFKSTIKETFGREIKTWPAHKPETCIDYIWVKGKNVEICSAETFGESSETDHKGIKCCLDII